MSRDLTLLITESLGGGDRFAQTVLQLDKDSELFEQIAEHEQELPGKLNSYFARDDEDERTIYGELKADEYGEPITWLSA